MIVGVNKVFPHEGRDFHIQAEDLESEPNTFEVRVYDKGAVLWRKRIPYADQLAGITEKLAREDAIRAAMEKTILTVQAAIAKGKIS